MNAPIYRLETNRSGPGAPQNYLAKDVHFARLRRKVRLYVGTERPDEQAIATLSAAHAERIETLAAHKMAILRSQHLHAHHLTADQVERLERVRELRRTIHRLGNPHEVERLEHDFELRYIAGTTAIEGNTLKPREATELLEHGTVPRGHDLRAINEVQNYHDVIAYRNRERGPVTHRFIRGLHRCIMNKIDHEGAGRYRRIDDIGIAGRDLALTPSLLIEDELDEAISDHDEALHQGHHPFEAAARFHHRFEAIHPFTDGNGRVGRELLNHQLTRAGYPRLLVQAKDRQRYLDALEAGDHEDWDGLVQGLLELHLAHHEPAWEHRLHDLARSWRH